MGGAALRTASVVGGRRRSAVLERGRWILRAVGIPLSVGHLSVEVARAAGVGQRDLDDLLAELAAELER